MTRVNATVLEIEIVRDHQVIRTEGHLSARGKGRPNGVADVPIAPIAMSRFCN
jgi:hypothetical protein